MRPPLTGPDRRFLDPRPLRNRKNLLAGELHCAPQYGIIGTVRGPAASSFGTADTFLHSPPMVESSARSSGSRLFCPFAPVVRRTIPDRKPTASGLEVVGFVPTAAVESRDLPGTSRRHTSVLNLFAPAATRPRRPSGRRDIRSVRTRIDGDIDRDRRRIVYLRTLLNRAAEVDRVNRGHDGPRRSGPRSWVRVGARTRFPTHSTGR